MHLSSSSPFSYSSISIHWHSLLFYQVISYSTNKKQHILRTLSFVLSSSCPKYTTHEKCTISSLNSTHWFLISDANIYFISPFSNWFTSINYSCRQSTCILSFNMTKLYILFSLSPTSKQPWFYRLSFLTEFKPKNLNDKIWLKKEQHLNRYFS